MKKLQKFYWVSVVVSALGLMQANAQIWDASFTGNELVDAPWVVNGVADVDGTNLILGEGAYGQLDNSPWAPVANDFTVEFVLSIQDQTFPNAYAQKMYVISPVGVWEVAVAINYARLEGVSGGFVDVALDGTQVNTYRLVVDNGLASLFLNGDATAAVNVAPNPYFESNFLSFGDRGSGVGGVGTWGSIQWNNSQALSPVPEPSTLALGGMVFLGAAVYLRRRASGRVVAGLGA